MAEDSGRIAAVLPSLYAGVPRTNRLTQVHEVVEADDANNERENKAHELPVIAQTDAVPDPGAVAGVIWGKT